MAAWVIVGWTSGGRSYDASRVRIAQVTRGDLVRDLSADGRVIAANSPTLYAIPPGTVALKVVAGDVVKQGEPPAGIDRPELPRNRAQEGSPPPRMEDAASPAA